MTLMDHMTILRVVQASTATQIFVAVQAWKSDCLQLCINLLSNPHLTFLSRKVNRAMLPAQQALLLRCMRIKQYLALRKLGAVLDQAQPNLQDRRKVLRLSSILHTGYCWYLC